MAPKRPSPLEEPPSASETEEEEELNGSEEEDEEDEEEDPPTPIQSSLKNPNNPNKTSIPKPIQSSSSDNDDSGDENADLPQDSDSEDTSDSDNEPVKHMIAHRNADVKPISSKPMLDASKSKKPAPAPAAKAAAKRPLEGDNSDKKSKKKKVSDIDEDGDHNDDSEKKTGKLFQRIWSDQDEIIILNGLIDFKKKGYNVSNNMGAFFDFIKDSLHVDVSKSQLNNKVQRLKQKYQNNANRAKPGEDPVISRPHEVKSYKLSKEIWGEHTGKVDGLEATQVTSDSGNPDVKKTKKPLNTNNIASPRQKVSIASPKQKVSILPDDKPPKVEAKEADSGSGLEYHYLNQSLKHRNGPMMPVPPLDLGEVVAKKGWDSAKTLDATSLNKRWKEVMIAETKAYLARLDLVREQTKSMLDELESSDS